MFLEQTVQTVQTVNPETKSFVSDIMCFLCLPTTLGHVAAWFQHA